MTTPEKTFDPVDDTTVESTPLIHEELSTEELAKMGIRNAILSKNDLPTIVGKQADLQEALLLAQAKLVTGMTTVKSFAELNALHREVSEPFQTLLTGIKEGDITLVHHAKGLDAQSVIDEALQATADTAEAFINSSKVSK